MNPNNDTPEFEDGYPVCQSCGDTYDLREGCDPTKYCDICAHEAVEALESELATLNARLMELQQVIDTVKKKHDDLSDAHNWYVADQSVHMDRLNEQRYEFEQKLAAQERVIADMKADKEVLDWLNTVWVTISILPKLGGLPEPVMWYSPKFTSQIDIRRAMAQTKAKEGGK